MRAPAVSFAKHFTAALLAALLTFTLLPANAFAEGEGGTGASAEGVQETGSTQVDEAAGANVPEGAEPDTAVSAPLASVLTGAPTAFVNADVALDGNPVVGSFTVDGLTFAVVDGSTVELVGVSEAAGASPRRVVASSQGLSAPLALPDLGSTPAASETEAESAVFQLPESASYNDVAYSVASIGAYAFYLSGVTAVELPSSIVDVDDRAFRSSDVASVAVAEGNPSYSSFGGALYDADQSSLLLIPEGKQGTVLLPKTAESAAPSVFSHCPLVTQVSVEEGSAAFASENGLLYDASLTTLLRVPAGATEITIREGCTTIAAGALEACASLATINAPASVTSISPDVFTSVPTISLPAAALVEDAPQLTALVALSTTDDDLPRVDPLNIQVYSSDENVMTWPAFVSNASKISAAFEASHQSITKSDREPVYAAHDDSASTLVDIDDAVAYGAGSNGSQIIAQNGHGRFYITQSNTSSYPVGYSTRFGIIGSIYTDWKMQITVADGTNGSKTSSLVCTSSGGYSYTLRGYTVPDEGYKLIGFNENGDNVPSMTSGTYTLANTTGTKTAYALFVGIEYRIMLDACGGYLPTGEPDAIAATYGQEVSLPVPERPGCRFLGWSSKPIADKDSYVGDTVTNLTTTDGQEFTFYAQWERVDYELGFDVDSEPGDEDCPGIEKPDETVNVESGPTAIEDPKRPGYVFQGWVIPDTATDEGNGAKEALDQELVYQGDDGKWYVDASKLPDYAGDDGRVELTARWTSVISVDVPSAATFYYDLVTDQSSEAHEAALSGTTSFSSRSQVDLRVCGLESVKASGADALFSSGADSALLSVYPAADGSATTVEDAQGPAGAKPSTAVDFALDDIVLEAAFSKAGPDAFSIPAGDDLTLSYRLNLGDGASLDYDKVLAMAEGDEASLASITYCFAADCHGHLYPDGTVETDELGNLVLRDENGEIVVDEAFYIVSDSYWWGHQKIKEAAKCIAQANAAGEQNSCYTFYHDMLVTGMDPADADAPHGYVLLANGAVRNVRLVALAYDQLAVPSSDCDKAGMTFEFFQCLATGKANTSRTVSGGWANSYLRNTLLKEGGSIWNQLPTDLSASIESVKKKYVTSNVDSTVKWTNDKLFPISMGEKGSAIGDGPVYELFALNLGQATKDYNGTQILYWLRTAQNAACWWRSDAQYPYCDVVLGIAPCFCL